MESLLPSYMLREHLQQTLITHMKYRHNLSKANYVEMYQSASHKDLFCLDKREELEREDRDAFMVPTHGCLERTDIQVV